MGYTQSDIAVIKTTYEECGYNIEAINIGPSESQAPTVTPSHVVSNESSLLPSISQHPSIIPSSHNVSIGSSVSKFPTITPSNLTSTEPSVSQAPSSFQPSISHDPTVAPSYAMSTEPSASRCSL